MKKVCCVLLFIILAAGQSFAGNTDTYGIGAKATAQGGAFAAQADNPFAIHYNPAGLTQMKGAEIYAGISMLDPRLQAERYTVAANPLLGTQQLGPADVADDSSPLFDPHLGFSMPIGQKFAIGLAAYTPYGLKLEWPQNYIRNPSASNSYEAWYARSVMTPTIAFKASDKLSFGLGVAMGQSVTGSKSKLSQANANALAYGISQRLQPAVQAGLMPAAQAAALVGAAQSLAGGTIEADLKDDFNYSVNLGVLYQATDELSLGLTYRSKASTDFEGDVEYRGANAQQNQALAAISALGVNSTATGKVGDLDAPDQLQIGARYLLTPAVSAELDLVWTNWSIVEHETVNLSRAFMGQPEIETRRSWNDTTQIRIGLEWKATDMLSLRGGYFYDPTPVPDDTFDVLWADADKKTYSLGFGLNWQNWVLDGAVQYTITERDRIIGGESDALNESYAGSEVSTRAYGDIWGYSMTVGYRF